MTIYFFRKSFACKGVSLCHTYVDSLLKIAYPVYQPGINGHSNISHNGDAHDIEFTLYTNGKHEYLDWQTLKTIQTQEIKTAYSAMMPLDSTKPI